MAVSPAAEPASKRQKIDPEEDEDVFVNEEEILKLLEGAKNDEDEAARQRRMKRRQRWQSADSNDAMNENVVKQTDDREMNRPEDIAVEKEQVEDNVIDGATTDDADEDDFDMFSSSVSPVVTKTTATTTNTNTKNDDFDDDEGYYKPVIGETIDCSSTLYKVLGVVGKGVFSTVLKAKDTTEKEVALKLIRNNETMVKAALTEIRVLRKLSPHPHVVELIHPTPADAITDHHNHVVMCFHYQQYNLRDVLQKFGRGVGISLQSVQLYFPQLLSALRHFQKHQVLHSDLKPDNILVSGDFSTLQVCDFGSATMLDECGMIPTPYLVSRYYRAPEIILGAVPSYPIDLWSASVTVVELFLGRVLFHGNTNNDMLLSMMQILGSFSPRQIKQHALQCRTHPGLPLQFDGAYFLQQDVDKATGALLRKKVPLQDFPTKPLQSILLKAKSVSDSRVLVLKFADLLRGCLTLDPSRRMNLRDAMHHEFFQPPKKKGGKEQNHDATAS